MRKLIASFFAAATVVAVAEAQRTNIRIVGSSTVFPFATAVVEEFGAITDYGGPVMSSDGSGGGMKLFCAGVGLQHPDISNASKRQLSKADECASNGVEFEEFMVGYDGIVLANAIDGPVFNLTREELAEALVGNHSHWSDINPDLPNIEIEVLGPPSTSGTRAAFEDLVTKPFFGKKAEIRQDGAYIESGENDSAIVDELESNPNAVGIFGYGFLQNNADRIKGAIIDDIEPTFDNIATGQYTVSRSLYFYVKLNHLGVIPGIEEYVELFVEMAEPGGELEEIGLIPGNDDDIDAMYEALDYL